MGVKTAAGGRRRTTVLVTGTHWPNTNEFAQLASVGYNFAVRTVNPGDSQATWAAVIDAADAAGLKLIIGGYPEPYTWNGSSWTVSSQGQAMLNYFATRASSILGLFVFNEPYFVGGYTAAQLRALRTAIRAVWPAAPVYHDLGEPAGWVQSGPYSGGSTNWNDQSGVCDLCGFWYYPFRTSGYLKTQGLATLAQNDAFIRSNMGAVPVFLGQSHAAPSDNLVYPSDAQISDWNVAIRGTLSAGSLISWYVWRQSLYPDYLVNHPSQWSLTAH